jgi:hypothetical protein
MTAPTFLPQTIGITENALRALLDHHLSGTDLTYATWVLLNGAAVSGGQIERARLESTARDALKIGRSEVAGCLARLRTAGFLETDETSVRLTDAGMDEHTRVRRSMAESTGFVLRDLPDDDVDATMRTLTKIAERANLLLGDAHV